MDKRTLTRGLFYPASDGLTRPPAVGTLLRVVEHLPAENGCHGAGTFVILAVVGEAEQKWKRASRTRVQVWRNREEALGVPP